MEPGLLGPVVGGPSHIHSPGTITALQSLPGGHLNHSSDRGLQARRTTKVGARISTDLVVHLATGIAVADNGDALGGTAVACGKLTTHRIGLTTSHIAAVTFRNVAVELTHGFTLATIEFIRAINLEGEACS